MNMEVLSQKILTGEVLTQEEREATAGVLRSAARAAKEATPRPVSFVAKDGTKFSTEARAAAYQRRADQLALVMAQLPQWPEGIPNGTGEVYLQHDYEKTLGVFNQVLDLVAEIMPPSTAQDRGIDRWLYDTRTKGPRTAHPSWVARVLGEYNDPALIRAYARFQRIDWATMREYGQQWFADHPAEAGDRCLNPQGVA